MENYSADVILTIDNEVEIKDKHGKFNIVEEILNLKKLTDPEFAQKCVVDKLLDEYKKYVDTDVWYEAALDFLNVKIDNHFLNWNNRKYITTDSINLKFTINDSFDSDDFIFMRKNGNKLSLNNILNDNPEVIGYEFEKHIISYAKEKNSSNI